MPFQIDAWVEAIPGGRDAARRHRRPGPFPGLLLLFVVVATACGSAPGASDHQEPVASGPSPSIVATPDPTRQTPDPIGPSSDPASGPTVFASTVYPYGIPFPPGFLQAEPRPATVSWDGSTTINSGDDQTDFFSLDGGRAFFAYGTQTQLTLDEFADLSQHQVAEWHGCPSEPSLVLDAIVDGAAARLHGFACQGAQVIKLMVIRSGFGMVFNQIVTTEDEPAARARFLETVALVRWH